MILSSCTHALPYLLGNIRYEFNAPDITQHIIPGEVPPDKMYELLTTRWGMGHNLAVTLIDQYGGNIYDISIQLQFWNDKGEYFFGRCQQQTDAVQRCLKFNGEKKRMRELLIQIAEKGFAPLSDVKDPEAAVISKHDVGGVVQRGQAMVIGLPDHVWGESTIGLVASVQSIRLAIANVLHNHPEVLADSAKVDSTGVVYDFEK